MEEQQSRFLSDRDIIDNIVIAQEVYHYIHTSRKRKKQWFIAKLDMEKAFDRVRWELLEALMHKMGFHSKWICWNMSCVASSKMQMI